MKKYELSVFESSVDHWDVRIMVFFVFVFFSLVPFFAHSQP